MDVKRGDAVIEVYNFGWGKERLRESSAVSVGTKWITTRDGTKYNRETGYGEYGWRLFTAATLAVARVREADLRTVETARWHDVDAERLARIAALVRLPATPAPAEGE